MSTEDPNAYVLETDDEAAKQLDETPAEIQEAVDAVETTDAPVEDVESEDQPNR